MKLRNTFTLLLAGMITLTVVPSLLIGMGITRGHIRRLVTDDMPATLAATRAGIQTEIARGWEASLALSRSPSLRQWFLSAETDESSGAVAREMMVELATRPGFATAFAANTITGRYWVKDQLLDTLVDSDPDDSWFFNTIKSTEELQLNLDYNQEMNTTNLWFNALVKDGQRTIGIAGIGISVDKVIADFRASVPSPRARVYLADATDTILVSSVAEVTNRPLADYVGKTLNSTGNAALKSYVDPKLGRMFYIEGGVANTPYRVIITAPEADFLPGFLSLCGLPLLYAILIATLVTVLGSLAVARAIVNPIKALVDSSNRLARGDVSARAVARTPPDAKAPDTDAAPVDGWATQRDAKNEIGDLARSFESMAASIREQAESSLRIAHGDLAAQFTERSDRDILARNMNAVINNLRGLVAETGRLTAAANQGDFSARGDAGQFPGGFGKVVDGMNATLDAAIAPLQNLTAILRRLAEGDLGARAIGNYQGDHAKIRDSLNAMAETLQEYIAEIALILEALSAGDLNREVVGDYRGDFSRVKGSLKLIVDSLNSVISQLDGAADQVAAGARQISETSGALAQGAAEQAETIDRIAGTVDELTDKTRQNAESATHARELAETARVWADKGNSRMAELATAMKAIDDSSADISRVIGVIDDIAFQTNILALNAAVEAARAGKHGKGFAIVADEVRNLAAKSANAARETMALIETSLKNVQSGAKVTDDAVAALRGIVESVEGTANAILRIEAASDEQTRGIASLTEGLERVRQVAQENTATSEESAAASAELSGQAQALKETVGNFTLKEGWIGGDRLQGAPDAYRAATTARPTETAGTSGLSATAKLSATAGVSVTKPVARVGQHPTATDIPIVAF